MPRLVDILGIGKSGLFASQLGISTAGHNIANVNNKDYTKQRISFETNQPEIIRHGQLGQGVGIESITRQIDNLLEKQIVSQKSILGEFSSQSSVLSQIESFFNENNGMSVSKAMDEFFNSFRDLSNNPSDLNQRLEVLARSEDLTTTFHRQFSHISDTQTGLNIDIKGKVDEINQLTQEIASLNKKIRGSEVLPSNANDLRDKLDADVKRIAELVNVNVFLDNNGYVNILTGNGAPLVVGSEYNILQARQETDGMLDIYHIRPNGETVNITDDINSGEIAGIIYARDTILEGYKTKLNELAYNFTTQINTVHQAGYDLNSNTGTNFFTNLLTPTNAARDIDLSISVLDNPEGIAASTELDALGNVVSGNNENALALIAIQDNLTMSGNSQTFNEYYRNLIYQIGNDKATNTEYVDLEEAKLEQLSNFREAISGVSIDEEMVNIIEFQRNFEASSKVIKTTDQMLQIVLSLKD